MIQIHVNETRDLVQIHFHFHSISSFLSLGCAAAGTNFVLNNNNKRDKQGRLSDDNPLSFHSRSRSSEVNLYGPSAKAHFPWNKPIVLSDKSRCVGRPKWIWSPNEFKAKWPLPRANGIRSSMWAQWRSWLSTLALHFSAEAPHSEFWLPISRSRLCLY